MEDSAKEERDLKEYVVKQNDRNIQRQRETGFTLYAVYGAIIYSVFYIIEHLQTIQKVLDKPELVELVCYISNIIVAFGFFLFAYLVSSRNQRITKIYPEKKQLNIEATDIPVLVTAILISSVNLISLKYTKGTAHSIYFGVFGSIAGLNGLSPFVIGIWKWIKRQLKKKKKQNIEELDFTMFNEAFSTVFKWAGLIYGCALLTFTIIIGTMTDIEIDANDVSSLVKLNLVVLGLLALVKIAIELDQRKRDHDEFEEFEREIYFDNLTNHAIVKRFEDQFHGMPFSKWISSKHKEIMDFFNQKRQEFLAIDLMLIDIDKIDKVNYPYEYEGRVKDVLNKQSVILQTAEDYVQKNVSTLSDIGRFGSLNNQELRQFNFVRNFFNHQVHSFNNQYSTSSSQVTRRQESKEISSTLNSQ